MEIQNWIDPQFNNNAYNSGNSRAYSTLNYLGCGSCGCRPIGLRGPTGPAGPAGPVGPTGPTGPAPEIIQAAAVANARSVDDLLTQFNILLDHLRLAGYLSSN